MSERRIVIFDLGGVLVKSAGREALLALVPHLRDEKLVLEHWVNSPAVGLFERGRMSPSEFAATFVREWGLDLASSEFLADFAGWMRGLYPEAESLVLALRAKYRVGCLSNTNAVHWAELTHVQELFDFCFASHLTGHMKPDHAAYEHALLELDAAPNSVYFFDDLAPNVAAARSLGMNAFLVRGAAEAKAAARTAGLLPNAYA